MSTHKLQQQILEVQRAYAAATGRDANAICVPSPELRSKIEPIAKERGLVVEKNLSRLPVYLFSLDRDVQEDTNA